VKIFGRSYPTLRNLEIVDNYSSPCGAGVSVQHLGIREGWVRIENCVFRKNRARVTGAALDLLEGSSAQVVNCLFTGNISNIGDDVVARVSGEAPFTNSGAITVFRGSRLWMQRCSITGNRNGIDDMSGEGVYEDSIFFGNELEGGLAGTTRFSLDLPKGGRVTGCLVGGRIIDPRNVVTAADSNLLNPPDPGFDREFIPKGAPYQGKGYRR
jgi:hypothetical protein